MFFFLCLFSLLVCVVLSFQLICCFSLWQVAHNYKKLFRYLSFTFTSKELIIFLIVNSFTVIICWCMPSFQLHPGFAGQSIRCNPWQPTQYLIAASQYYGVAGSGKVYLVQPSPFFQPNSPVTLIGCWGTADGAFDASISEVDQNTVVVACGDGVKVYNVAQSINRDNVLPLIHNK